MSSKSQLAAVTDSDQHCRDNFWGDEDDQSDAQGHAELTGTDAAEYVWFQIVIDLTEPICERTKHTPAWNGGRMAELFAWCFDDEQIDGHAEQLHHEQREEPLSEPAVHLPKQIERGGRIIDYGQYPHRRRHSESGYINWGETTTTEIPEIGFDQYMQAVHNYLAVREAKESLTLTRKDEYLSLAKRLFYDQHLNSHKAGETLVRKVREEEGHDND